MCWVAISMLCLPTSKRDAETNVAKRTLEANEKKKIIEDRRQQEIAAHPDKMIAVQVDDETDESGNPVVRVRRIGERETPKGWRSDDA